MMSDIVIGNVIKQEGIIVQQVNCQGVMGSGLAKQIRRKFPRNYKEYKEFCDTHNGCNESYKLLGKVLFVSVTPIQQLIPWIIVANLFGQDRYGTDKQHTNYEALRNGLKEINDVASRNNIKVSIPYNIGCGLGGGDWNEVYKIIKETMVNAKYTIYKLREEM